MPLSSKIALVLLTAVAAGLRFRALFANHFHPDEALFASWARLIAIGRDPLLLSQAVDKPPLLFYLAAPFYPLFGPVEFATRWPNLAASILLVPLTAVLAWRLYRRTALAVPAAALVAASPLAIQFSATMFTDPLLTFFLVASLLFIVGRPRPFWSGLCFGLAALTKHQAWLFLPLLVGLAWIMDWRTGQWRRWLAGMLPPLLLILAWGLGRGGSGMLVIQWRNFGGLRPSWSWELDSRLRSWSGLWSYLFGLLLGLAAVPALILPWLPGRGQENAQLADRWVSLFIAAYLGLHWLLAIPAWDRYLLPLVPLLALLLARLFVSLLEWVLRGMGRRRVPPVTAVASVSLLVLLVPVAWMARNGRFPIGGFPDADQGAWQVREYLQEAPYGTVLYDHWFSWHWGYAFIDKGVYTSWFPYPAALAEDLAVFGAVGERYLVVPDGAEALPVLRAVTDAGYEAEAVLQSEPHPGMILYRLDPAMR